MTSSKQPSQRHLRALQRALEKTRAMTTNYSESSEEQQIRAESLTYAFDVEHFDLWYALGFLIAGDHELSREELKAVLLRTRDLPKGWGNAIYFGGPRGTYRTHLVFARGADGTIADTEVASLGFIPMKSSKEKSYLFPAEAAQRSRSDTVMVDMDGEDLLVLIARPSRALGMRIELVWWAADEEDDHHGTAEFQVAEGLGGALEARVHKGGLRRTFCMIVMPEATGS